MKQLIAEQPASFLTHSQDWFVLDKILLGLITKNGHINDSVRLSVFSSITHCVLETNNDRRNVLTHILVNENLET